MALKNGINRLSRRTFVQLAGLTAAGCSLTNIGDTRAEAESGIAVPLFDGKTLDGWIQIENDATSLPVDGIADPSAFAGRLAKWHRCGVCISCAANLRLS
jgi:hypothetical protein